jgi:hypothetical protein
MRESGGDKVKEDKNLRRDKEKETEIMRDTAKEID